MSREAVSHVLTGLEPKEKYDVWMTSTSASQKVSEPTDVISREVAFSGRLPFPEYLGSTNECGVE